MSQIAILNGKNLWMVFVYSAHFAVTTCPSLLWATLLTAVAGIWVAVLLYTQLNMVSNEATTFNVSYLCTDTDTILYCTVSFNSIRIQCMRLPSVTADEGAADEVS